MYHSFKYKIVEYTRQNPCYSNNKLIVCLRNIKENIGSKTHIHSNMMKVEYKL